jgi:predicted lipoprotein
MPTESPSVTQRPWFWAASIVLVVAGFWLFPIFRVVPIDTRTRAASAAGLEADAFLDRFWNDRLLPTGLQAVDAVELLTALRQDSAATAKQYGHRLGLSSTTSYFFSGTGRISDITPSSVSIALGDDPTAADLVIEFGPVFGNAIRDGSGLLDVSDFPNSRDFNALSDEFNRRVEERVFPALQAGAVLGATVRFIGAAEITHPATNLQPLRMIPVLIEFP